jgi:hypothetical protein
MNEKITITEINKTRFQMNLLNKIYVTWMKKKSWMKLNINV